MPTVHSNQVYHVLKWFSYFQIIWEDNVRTTKRWLYQDNVKVSVILHNVLSSSLEDLIKSCNSFHAFILASRMSSCSLRTSSTCLLSASMPRVGFFSCEYNSVWFKKTSLTMNTHNNSPSSSPWQLCRSNDVVLLPLHYSSYLLDSETSETFCHFYYGLFSLFGSFGSFWSFG